MENYEGAENHQNRPILSEESSDEELVSMGSDHEDEQNQRKE